MSWLIVLPDGKINCITDYKTPSISGGKFVTTIPLVKDKTGNIDDVNNYRGVTLSPVISKLLEVVLLSLCSYALVTDFLQFNFKDKIGTVDAIFTLNSTIKHFVDRGSSVYISSYRL